MNKLCLLSFTLWVGFCAAQTSPQNPADVPGPNDTVTTKTVFSPGTLLRLELDKSIDAKKAKVGDPVVAKMMDELLAGNQVVAPRGAKVLGHVAEVSAHQGDTPSTLGIVFDKILVKDQEVAMSATIQAIGRTESNFFSQNPSTGGMSPGGNIPSTSGSAPGRISPGMGTPSGTPQNPGGPGAPSADPLPPTINGELTTSSQGVIGMSGVSLAAGSGGESVLTSQKHNVKLEGGTQLIVRTQ